MPREAPSLHQGSAGCGPSASAGPAAARVVELVAPSDLGFGEEEISMRTWATYWLNYKADRERRLVPIDSWHFPRNRRTECERLRHGGRLVLFVPGLSVDQEPAHHGHVVGAPRGLHRRKQRGNLLCRRLSLGCPRRGDAVVRGWCQLR